MATVNSSTAGGISFLTSSSLGTAHMNGMASGLDIDALVAATIQVESLPMQLMQNKNALLQARLNDYNAVKTALFTLKNAATDLTRSSAFSARTTSTTDDKIATATAKNGAANGSYSVDVTQLATATRISGGAIAGMTTGDFAKATGTSVDTSTAGRAAAQHFQTTLYVNNVQVSIADGDSFNDIVNKINQSSAGVTAKVVGDHLELTQKTAGVKPISIAGDDAALLDFLGLSAPTKFDGSNADNTVTFASLAAGNALSGVTDGYFSINGAFIKVDTSTDTLDSIIRKINSSSAGVTAIYDATTKTMSLTAKKAGAETITLTSEGSDFLDRVGLTAATPQPGQPAIVKVNGVDVTAVDNTVTMNDVTITLKDTGKTTITVSNDVDSMVQKVKSFIEQYNTVIDMVNTKLSEKPDDSGDPKVGDLFGDMTLRFISQKLRSFSYTVLSSASPSMMQLTQVGITTGPVNQPVADSKTGHLSLDEEKLRTALTNDPSGVAKLFGNSYGSDTKTMTGDGTTTSVTLAHPNVSSVYVKVGNIMYTQVAGTPKPYDPTGTPPQTQHQFSVDPATGVITFGDPLPSGQNIEINYYYDIPDASKGIFVQMAKTMETYTSVGGTFDSLTGSDGSITNQINYNTKRINEMNERLLMRQSTLYSKYQAMESQLQLLKSQSSFVTSLLAGLSSNSNSSSK